MAIPSLTDLICDWILTKFPENNISVAVDVLVVCNIGCGSIYDDCVTFDSFFDDYGQLEASDPEFFTKLESTINAIIHRCGVYAVNHCSYDECKICDNHILRNSNL